MSIKDWPVNERPREKLLANGVHSLSDAELLAVLLGGSGRRGLDAVAMARELLSRHQSLRGLLSAQRNPGLAAPVTPARPARPARPSRPACPPRGAIAASDLPATAGCRRRWSSHAVTTPRPCAPDRRSTHRRRHAIF
jgi:hypothetical protein